MTSDIVMVGSVPATVADRTIVDLCGERTVDVLSEMMAIGIRRDLTSLASLEEREVRAGRLRGRRVRLALLALAEALRL